ncbi:MAG TPA: uroporphyrinogen-III synthase [Rhodanobacter sp.]
MAAPTNHETLRGRTVVITRPAGTATAMAQQARARGGVPLLLPGLALRSAADEAAVRDGLRAALADDVLIFSSPAAVRFAARLAPLQTAAAVLAVGEGTARVLRRHRIEALTPSRQDSDGVLAHPLLRDVRNRRIALIGAPGGRGVLREQLAMRHAVLREVHVYQRVAPRLGHRHADAVMHLPTSALVLLSSAEALQNLTRQLPAPALEALRAATAVVSSERLAAVARAAGFTRIAQAVSALTAHLLDAAARVD